MKVSDPELWARVQADNPPPEGLDPKPATWPENLTDEQMGSGYGSCVVYAAQRWAEVMEGHLAQGGRVDEVADASFRTVDAELGRWGLTGFQYGAAVGILARCWVHGEELRVWHNLATQIGDEGERANESGGVLNPALLTVETQV